MQAAIALSSRQGGRASASVGFSLLAGPKTHLTKLPIGVCTIHGILRTLSHIREVLHQWNGPEAPPFLLPSPDSQPQWGWGRWEDKWQAAGENSENNHILPGSDTSTGAFTSIFPHCLCHFTDGKTEAQGSQNDKPRGSRNRVGMTSLRFSLQHPRSLSCTRRVGIRDRRLVSTLPDTEQEKTRARVRGCQGWSFSSRRGKKKQKGNVRPRGSDPNPAPGSED